MAITTMVTVVTHPAGMPMAILVATLMATIESMCTMLLVVALTAMRIVMRSRTRLMLTARMRAITIAGVAIAVDMTNVTTTTRTWKGNFDKGC